MPQLSPDRPHPLARGVDEPREDDFAIGETFGRRCVEQE
jgi:hypothetical protein